jgi:predicted metal-dependent peptidase
MAYDLEKDMYRLLIRDTFFAVVSRYLEKRAVANIPTAGVRVTEDGRFELVYNEKFMGGLPDNHRIGVIKHELYHLVLEHCLKRSPDGRKISKRWNYATDMAINCHLKGELPDFAVMPEKFGYENYLSAEAYYKLLEQDNKGGNDSKCDGNHSAGEGEGGGEPCDCGNFDDHGGWGEGNGENPIPQDVRDMARERLREAVGEAVKEAQKSSENGWGKIPQDMRKEIMRFVNGTVDWKAVLRMFIGNAQRSTKQNTVKRINRRFPYIHAGKKTNRTANIAISIDQSGSVSDEMLSLFYAELDNLAKLASFTIIPFDTRVGEDKIYVWKKGERRKKERVMCGGTDFDAPTEYVNKHREYDGHIVLTDMQAPAPKPSRVRRMWMTDMDGAENPYFKTNERVIPIKNKVKG